MCIRKGEGATRIALILNHCVCHSEHRTTGDLERSPIIIQMMLFCIMHIMDFDSVARQAETWLEHRLAFYTRMLSLINSARTAGAVFSGAFHICKIDIEYCLGSTCHASESLCYSA